jgi:hypothetical protein
MIETDRVLTLGAPPESVETPSESGLGQTIGRCPECRVALWSHYADGAGPLLAFVRVGTLDNPDRAARQEKSQRVHFFTPKCRFLTPDSDA